MNLGVFEDGGYRQLLPLTWLRPAFELRCGMDRLIEKAQTHLRTAVNAVWVRETLRAVVLERLSLSPPAPADDWCLLNARALLTGNLAPPPPGVAWERNGGTVAFGLAAGQVAELSAELFLSDEALRPWLEARKFQFEHAPEAIRLVEYPWNLVLANEQELRRQCRQGGRHAGRVHPGAHLLNPGEIHIGRDAVVKPGVVLDAESGPIHIAAGAQIQPNATLIGPCYVGEGAVVRPNSCIREGATIGPMCRVGGEISASIFQGYGNKQHEGFCGHSFVAEWVNLGAATVTSNLKNTYGTIRVYLNGVGVESGQHFLGAIIGDHAKTGIGTILPTGCVIGVASNLFTQRAVPRFVPSFAWLTGDGMTHYRTEKAVQIARVVMARRDVHLSEAEIRLLELTAELARETEVAGWA